MKVISIEPDDRIVSLQKEDTEDKDYRYLMVNLPKYYCPDCDDITAFNIQDKIQKIPDNIKKAFDKETKIKNKYEEGYIDIMCRICGKPARLIYKIREFHMAAQHYYAKEVLEIVRV